MATSNHVNAHRSRGAGDGLDAASSESQFRSGIFSFAISSTCFFVTVPTLFLFGSADPFAQVRGALQQDRRRRRLRDEGVARSA